MQRIRAADIWPVSLLGTVEPGDASVRRRRRPHPKFAAVIMCFVMAIGIYLVVGGLHRREQLSAVSGGVLTTGTVVNVRVDDSGQQPLYAPVVTFSTAAGRRIEFTAPTGTRQPVLGGIVGVCTARKIRAALTTCPTPGPAGNGRSTPECSFWCSPR